MKIFELKNKQVINEEDCCIIGCVIDIDFDPKNGCINSIIIPGPGRLCGFFGREFVYVIPFRCIKSIGVTLSLSMSALINIKKMLIYTYNLVSTRLFNLS